MGGGVMGEADDRQRGHHRRRLRVMADSIRATPWNNDGSSSSRAFDWRRPKLGEDVDKDNTGRWIGMYGMKM